MNPTIVCPDCQHGIDPHGVDPGGWCGVGDEYGHACACLLSPNDIAAELLRDANRRLDRVREILREDLSRA